MIHALARVINVLEVADSSPFPGALSTGAIGERMGVGAFLMLPHQRHPSHIQVCDDGDKKVRAQETLRANFRGEGHVRLASERLSSHRRSLRRVFLRAVSTST